MRLVGIPLRLVGASHGNLNYLVNLAICLQTRGARWQPVVLTSRRSLPARVREVLTSNGTVIVDAPYFSSRQSSIGFLQAMVSEDRNALEVARRSDLACLFENAAFYGRQCGIPALHWIPDLQHRELPEMFPWAQRLRRTILVRCVVESDRQILLSSEAARDALKRYYSLGDERLHVAAFASALIGTGTDTDVEEELVKLGISVPFAFIPNQFWRHKNHAILARAARLLRKRGMVIKFVCTGEQRDPRSRKYSAQFQELLDQCEVRDDFVLPGVVPYSVIQKLHQRCEVLVNPSFVEGWNTGVEEAKYYGSTLVLSNIATHREQVRQYQRAVVFDPCKPESLADALEAAYRMGRPSDAERDVARKLYDARIQSFVEAVELALDSTVSACGSSR